MSIELAQALTWLAQVIAFMVCACGTVFTLVMIYWFNHVRKMQKEEVVEYYIQLVRDMENDRDDDADSWKRT